VINRREKRKGERSAKRDENLNKKEKRSRTRRSVKVEHGRRHFRKSGNSL